MIARAKNENAPLERGGFSATTTKHSADVNPNRAAADDGSLTYFVVSPWGHIQKFSDIDALRAFAEKGARA